MTFLKIKKLSLDDLEKETSRVQKAKYITNNSLNIINSLSEDKISELENLKANLELLKGFDKKESKKKHIKFLEEREKNFNLAISKMKELGLKIYDPRDGLLD